MPMLGDNDVHFVLIGCSVIGVIVTAVEKEDSIGVLFNLAAFS
jgi:hypothetical protein